MEPWDGSLVVGDALLRGGHTLVRLGIRPGLQGRAVEQIYDRQDEEVGQNDRKSTKNGRRSLMLWVILAHMTDQGAVFQQGPQGLEMMWIFSTHIKERYIEYQLLPHSLRDA